MKNRINITVALVFFSVLQIFSQKKCGTQEEVFVDLNAINKCTVETAIVKTKESKTKYIVTSSTRYLKKRSTPNAEVHLASNLKTKTVVETKKPTKITESLLTIIKNEAEKENISFDAVDHIPLFASCDENSLDKVHCFNMQMEQHIVTNFEYPKEALKKGIEGDFEVSFVIDKNGKVKDIKVLGENDNIILKKEAMRIVLLLPKFTPGKQKGALVSVLYKFPMNFTLN
ncbi:energy transducer TonB [Tenacibaculum finnmarkense]|uniref:TonB family protein n=1 Tax=Tenacibaculum finnmarkense genomovar finnmarkense TaxID=1458503 RepID=A0AAP1RCZ7_9FLAO|nr:energy transducer TonB [Tenacibaculum finnmarkense]MBE7651585.1 TonB family protein [Tenacibaculum finnmarkense genomovar finnmarkense]MBE7694066.1 TonB family protein [Tenacibaculum finnmarkense genomovar finnmarkense]MCD8426576.1 energy transducer TonB [Tenacibaculum finnmarkense genomovar finnmarkense]MCG8730368.1 energy transducer TonB [Tenacibaculum finnmarkense]MCG8750798.1 energy transducer TonB [Tenacibaculum finnmarkense]